MNKKRGCPEKTTEIKKNQHSCCICIVIWNVDDKICRIWSVCRLGMAPG